MEKENFSILNGLSLKLINEQFFSINKEANQSISLDNLFQDNSSDHGHSSCIIYIEFPGDEEKTNLKNLQEWFSADFFQENKVFAIKEEEPFYLKIYTHVREAANKKLRKKGGRKSILFGKEVYGEVFAACGRCGYYSQEGSNVRRHLKKAICNRDRGYSRNQLQGLDKVERQKFIRRIASAKFRAKKKLKDDQSANSHQLQPPILTAESAQLPTCTVVGSNDLPVKSSSSDILHQKPKSNPIIRSLRLGPLEKKSAVAKISFDVFYVDENDLRYAWKPPTCHKAPKESPDGCQIVFKGARMKRRCLDLPLPIILTYRKLDCKTHHCNFTLFHPHARKTFKLDPTAKSTIVVRNYGDTVMTQEFYHYFVSLMSIMKMKYSQTARHLTSTWETILCERQNESSVPDEFRKLITLSKQTVKSLWKNIEENEKRPYSVKVVNKKIPKQQRFVMQPDNGLINTNEVANDCPVIAKQKLNGPQHYTSQSVSVSDRNTPWVGQYPSIAYQDYYCVPYDSNAAVNLIP